MTTYQDLVDTMRLIQERTGDPLAWMVGLTPDERIAAVSPPTTGAQLAEILAKIRRQHPDLFSPPASPAPARADRADGDAAKAIADAEAALAHQNSMTSQLDLQVVSAILNAHLTTVEGRDALTKLQHEIETAVATRSDLDTPSGARDFQRLLIGKLRDIREVVATASLDDTSKSALMAAWTSLYNASKNAPETSPTPRPASEAAPSPGRGADRQPMPAVASEPLPDSFLLDDPGSVPAGASGPLPAATSAPATAPSAGGGTSPAGASMPALGAPSGFALPNLPTGGTGRGSRSLDDGLFDDDPVDRESAEDKKRDAQQADHRDDEHRDPAAEQPAAPLTGPTTVTLPTGETVTAASPQLAAAIKAAAAGTPIADAFQQQGMTIPSPGTAVSAPLDPSRVEPGDIGMFTDRHALALGRSKALLDGQIQHISTVTGPSFLGWEHPPAPAGQTTAPPTDTPTPTRPSATA
ncbi:DUF4226 domain-containing protein [Mycobacterium paragordonae]|uniref:DUF4226 domain-containing protein n=1 Tax=Mycobacterium paragordonae TaxID=1389713 RepID=A0AAJ1SGE7_9MYCO|nr:DUF4226 domain-containing protein [Mycobacterium paragordonae]MDP7737933.1 DUF4226 domain-containing protein [Mycobacterium paragordonae]